MNSLEDAFLKIAETDIREKEEQKREEGKEIDKLTDEEEAKWLEEYFKYEGQQSISAKIWYVLLHRLQLFYRSSFQWAAALIPIFFVTM